MIKLSEIFKRNIQFSKYGRSGSIVITVNKNIAKTIEQAGWKCYLNNGIYRLNPPTITLIDIIDIEKALQYQNLIFNYALYKYIMLLKQKGILHEYISEIIGKHKIFFNNFEFHISIGPILKYTVKIEGSDNRIYKLKKYLINYVFEDKRFTKLYNEYINIFSKVPNIKQKYVKKENVDLQENYINQYKANDYKSRKQSFKIDFRQIELERFDYIIFILNGCFKIIPYFDIDKYKNKIIFWEVHIDKTKGADNFNNIDNLKNKSILIVDSIYSGKTILYIKKKLKNITDNVSIMGVFPKSDSVANICDYIIILNKVIKKDENGFNIEEEILKILGGKFEKQ